jgi:hypothetical protein
MSNHSRLPSVVFTQFGLVTRLGVLHVLYCWRRHRSVTFWSCFLARKDDYTTLVKFVLSGVWNTLKSSIYLYNLFTRYWQELLSHDIIRWRKLSAALVCCSWSPFPRLSRCAASDLLIQRPSEYRQKSLRIRNKQLCNKFLCLHTFMLLQLLRTKDEEDTPHKNV